MYKEHISVLLNECEEYLLHKPDLDYLDITFGGGGHYFSFLESGKIKSALGLDQDIEAYNNGKKKIEASKFSDIANIKHINFGSFVKDNTLKFDSILGDIGVSSHHFDSDERGFSFKREADLDMRMNTTEGEKASDVLNSLKENELADMFYHYGEERLSRKIAARIVEKRRENKIIKTSELEEICFLAYPKHMRHKKPHPATRVFQALRIYVNDELNILEQSIPGLLDALKPGGRLGLISFHSLEDRIVKHSFRKAYQNDQDKYAILTKRPLIATDEEVSKNPRSRSAKLRVIEKK